MMSAKNYRIKNRALRIVGLVIILLAAIFLERNPVIVLLINAECGDLHGQKWVTVCGHKWTIAYGNRGAPRRRQIWNTARLRANVGRKHFVI
jgi:hypothetical protein